MISTMCPIALKICIPSVSRLDLEAEEGHLSSARVKKEIKTLKKVVKVAKKELTKNTNTDVKDPERKKSPKKELKKL